MKKEKGKIDFSTPNSQLPQSSFGELKVLNFQFSTFNSKKTLL